MTVTATETSLDRVLGQYRAVGVPRGGSSRRVSGLRWAVLAAKARQDRDR